VIAVCGMDNVVDGYIAIKEAGMCIVVVILTVKEETAATLGVQVPKQYTKAALGQKAGEIDRCGGFSYAALDIIYCNLFQSLKLQPKH
jgi:hypothetical protein